MHCYKVEPGKKIKLKDFDPSDHGKLNKEEAAVKLAKLGKELEELEDLLFFAGQTSVLVVLQGLDSSGKDGTIRNILTFVNAQSCRVASFKVPTPIELGHDYLWRVHAETPRKGGMTIFNRSHYEDVLAVRVHGLVPKDVWKKRYDEINSFEKLLTDSGTIVLKFFLHISKDEQEQRLLEREQETEKAWKLSVGDWKERERWDDYIDAYEDVLSKCSTDNAPWFIVPANHKWYRNLAITEALVKALSPMKKQWLAHLNEIGVKAKAELEVYRAQQKK